MNVVDINTMDLHPYEKNNKKHPESQVRKISESIKEFGFIQPIVIDANNVIVAGHGRWLAAQRLKLEMVPCVYVDELTEDQIKMLRIVDNRVVSIDYDVNNLVDEVSFLQTKLDVSPFFDDWNKTKKKLRAGWSHTEKRCDLVQKFTIKRAGTNFIYHSFFKTTETGRTFDDIKSDRGVVELFSDNVCDFLDDILGVSYGDDWCILTTPKRRHTGWHFASEVCKLVQNKSGLRFVPEAFITKNRRRLAPEFEINSDGISKNVILYDDIITTGKTIDECRNKLRQLGCNVFIIVSIDNR